MKQLWPILQQTMASWNAHNAPRLGAALAFYTILSMAPLVVLVVAVVALVFGHSTAQDQILYQVREMIGDQGAEMVKTTIEHASKPSTGIFASIIGVLTLFFGASGVFIELRSALNTIWEVKEIDDVNLVGIVKQRFFSFGLVLAIGFLLLVSLVISAGLAAVGTFFGGLLPMPEFVLTGLNFVLSFIAIAVLFALIFKYVPEKTLQWRQVWVGALVTAFLFSIGKLLIGLYLGKASIGSAYGAAGSLMVVIVWVYYSSQIFFFGAEFTYALTNRNKKSYAADAF